MSGHSVGSEVPKMLQNFGKLLPFLKKHTKKHTKKLKKNRDNEQINSILSHPRRHYPKHPKTSRS